MAGAGLIFENNYLKINNFLHHQKDVYYNTLFDLEVRSGHFCGVAPCEYDMVDFRKFVNNLCEMYDFKKKQVALKDICYGSKVDFEMDRTGHIKISGEIFGEAMEHSLKFSFIADQFVLKQFISELQKLIVD